jgi:hypothetical protein
MNSVGYEFVTNSAPEPLGSGTLGYDASVAAGPPLCCARRGQAGFGWGRPGNWATPLWGAKRMAVGLGSASSWVSAHGQFCYLKFLFLFQICL